MSGLLIRFFVKNPEDLKNPIVRAAYGRMCGLVGIACNLVLVAGKFLAGILSGSISITADAINNLSDAASSIITLAGFRLAAKPADKHHPFGHARFEYISGLAVALLVMVIGIELGKSSFQKILQPTPVSFTWVTFLVLSVSILLKIWMAFFNRKIGHKIGSGTLKATYADSRNDVLTTGAVLLAALIARFTGLNLDGWMGLAVAIFILISGFFLVRDTLNPLLGTAPDPELVRSIRQRIESYPGVLGTHDLIVHDYGPGRRFASAHVEMSAEADVLASHEVIDDIEWSFLKGENLHLIVHYDPVQTDGTDVSPARAKALAAIHAIDPHLTLHDFRMVTGHTHDNYIFDVVLPEKFPLPEEEILRRIGEGLQTGARPIHTHITIDRSYSPIPK